MSTNQRKVQILPLLDKIIACLHNKSQKKKIKNQALKKFQFSTICGKKVQNLTIFGKIIAYLQNQTAKNSRGKEKSLFWRSSQKTGSLCWFSKK